MLQPKGEGTLPQELLKAIAPPLLDLQLQQQFTPTGGSSQDISFGKIAEDQVQHFESNEKDSQVRRSSNRQNVTKEEAFERNEKVTMSTIHMQKAPVMMKEPAPMIAARKEEQKNGVCSVMSDQEAERNVQKLSIKSDPDVERGNASQFPSSDGDPTRKPEQLQSPASAPIQSQAPAPTQSPAHGRFQVHGQGQGQGLGQGQGQAQPQMQVQAQTQTQAQAQTQSQTQPQSTTRDARTARNRGVAKYHERMLREFSKRKDDGCNKRMEALKNNDVERYREMLLEQQTNITGDAAERYTVLSSFLSQTESIFINWAVRLQLQRTHRKWKKQQMLLQLLLDRRVCLKKK